MIPNLDGPTSETEDQILCALILHLLTLLLLRTHRTRRLLTHSKSGLATDRLIKIDELAFTPTAGSHMSRGSVNTTTGSVVNQMSPVLAPIISLLQYRTFCASMHSDLNKLASELRLCGLSCDVMFTPVGESAEETIAMLERVDGFASLGGHGVESAARGGKDDVGIQLSGEALLWVNNR